MQAIKYIGSRPQFVDRLFGTHLTWAPEQVRMLPPHLAAKFLRHPDVFALVKPAAAKKAVKDDDTAELLEQAERDKAREDQAQMAIQALYLEVSVMDKEALDNFAQRNYRQTIDKRHPVEDLRQQVVRMIDQFGVV